MKGRIVAGVIALLFGGGALYALMPAQKSNETIFDASDQMKVAQGREIYARECAACHGADRQGQENWEKATAENPLAPPHDGSGHTWEHPDGALFDLTKYGLSTVACRTLNSDAMPKFEEMLDDNQIIAVLSYIKSEWSPEIRAQNAEINKIYGN